LDLLGNIISELLGIIIVSLVLPAIWVLITLKAKKREKNLSKLIERNFDSYEIDSDEQIKEAERENDRLRQKISEALKNGENTYEGFKRLNKQLNSVISRFRISYLRWLLKAHKGLEKTIETIAADGEISKSEVLFLLKEIDNATYLTPEERNYYKTHISETLIKRNRIHDPDELIAMDTHLKERVKWRMARPYILLGAPILLGGMAIVFFFLNRPKPDFTFGVIGFVSEKRFDELSGNMERYLEKRTGKKFSLECYGYDRYKDLIEAIRNGTVQGLMANPGTYLTIMKHKEDSKIVLDNMEIFASHKVEGKRDIRSVIITRGDSLQNFCNEKGYTLESMLPGTGNRTPQESKRYKKRVREYLCGSKLPFGLVKRYSFSGFLFPRIYLRSPSVFNIRLATRTGIHSEINIDVSGDHDLSVQRVLDGTYRAAATYDGKIYCLKKEEKEKLVVLYYSPPAPYNSYWFRKDTPEDLKKSIRSAFADLGRSGCDGMDDETCELARAIRNNPSKIGGWFLCDTDTYAKRFAKIANRMRIPSPRPLIIYEIEAPEWKITLRDKIIPPIAKVLGKNKICDVVPSGKTRDVAAYLFRYNLDIKERIPLGTKKDVLTIEMSNDSKTSPPLEDIREQNGDNERNVNQYIINWILGFILKNISFEATVYYDNDGPFINYGVENGIIVDKNGRLDTRKCELFFKKDDKNLVPIPPAKIGLPQTTFTPLRDVVGSSFLEHHKNEVVIIRYNVNGLVDGWGSSKRQ